MTIDTNAIQFIQDLFQIVIGAVQDGSINQLGIWGIHHLKLVILGTPRVLLPFVPSPFLNLFKIEILTGHSPHL